MSYDYDYIRAHKKKVLAMEKANPRWEPTLIHTNRISGGASSVASGHASVGFNDLSTFNNFYQKVQKGYKSSGNRDGYYYNRNELDKINKANIPYINYDKSQYHNATRDFKGKPEIFESILDVVEDKNDYGLLQGPKKHKVKKAQKDGGSVNVLRDLLEETQGLQGGAKIKKGGKFKPAKFKKGAENLGEASLKIAMKQALPEAGKKLAEDYGFPPTVGKTIGRIIADVGAKQLSKLGGAITPIRKVSSKIKNLSVRDRKILEGILRKGLEESHDIKSLQGGSALDAKKLKKGLKGALKVSGKISKAVGPSVLKIGLPAISAGVGQSAGIPAPVAGLMGKIAGDVLSKAIFGKGVNDKVVEIKESVTGGQVGGASTPQKRRAVLVKRIMKDKGMSLPQASKYIKVENLKY